jgi:hypothetical protein
LRRRTHSPRRWQRSCPHTGLSLPSEESLALQVPNTGAWPLSQHAQQQRAHSQQRKLPLWPGALTCGQQPRWQDKEQVRQRAGRQDHTRTNHWAKGAQSCADSVRTFGKVAIPAGEEKRNEASFDEDELQGWFSAMGACTVRRGLIHKSSAAGLRDTRRHCGFPAGCNVM